MPRNLLKTMTRISIWLCLLLSVIPVMAQDNSVTFTGTISEVTETTIVVGGVAVDISTAVLPVDGVAVGLTVQVIGVADGQTIRATLIVLTGDDSAPPAPEQTAEPAPEQTAEPVPQVTPQPSIVIDGEPLIVIEGPVQEINITSIKIFNITIEVDPADEVLTQIRIGDTIRVAGQSSFENNTIIIVAINITIVQTSVIIVNNPGAVYIPVGIPANCKLTGRGNGRITCKNSSRRSSR